MHGSFLNLLGWDHAEAGAKAFDVSEEFALLEVNIELKNLHLGVLHIVQQNPRN